ncbi:Tat pathway signal protein [Streptomyces tateyamensis]|uniref:Tat pathway signal protein n=1 Tax=Streptomyces tateyamensis TaxID=565073 RepID=A0A2V4P9Q1_9ACTN|nr:chaplin [Streptomyces tateyamensis]PYC87662.1 Tat pathway signal protein [Streptomyces tateyamensis]
MRQVARKGILTAVATGSVLASTAGYAYATADAEGAAANSPGVASGNAVSVPVEAPVNVCGNTVDVVGLLNPAYGNQCANHSTHGGGHGGGSSTGGDNGGSNGGSNGPTSGGDNGGSNSPTGGSTDGSTGGSMGGPAGGSTGGGGGGGPQGGSNGPTAGSSASGVSQGSPGVASGNNGQAPVEVPLNACGNSVDVIGLLNPVMGNDCAQHGPAATPPPGADSPTCPPEQQTPPTTEVKGESGTRAPAQPVAQAPAAPVVAQAPQTRLASTGIDGLGIVAPAGLALLIGGGVLYRRGRRTAA